MSNLALAEIEGRSSGYYSLLGLLAAVVAVGLGAAWYMEHHGHIVSGMNNQIIWGMPHVFALFLIVAASGALNVASIASVFGKTPYKPLAALSGLVAISLLAGGLLVLVLDLGRPERLVVAMTNYNFKSIFAWNIMFYTGFFVIVAAYLWTMLDFSVRRFNKAAGIMAFLWRLSLTTCTGSVFGFLLAREAYDTAVLAPTFIVLSLSYGTAAFILVLLAAYRGTERPLGDDIVVRLGRLQAIFVAGGLYFVAVLHLTNLYMAKRWGIEHFLLVGGGEITALLWVGQVLIGSVVPMFLLFHPGLVRQREVVAAACTLILAGGLAQMYVTIIGGQAYPLELFPGMEETSNFFDGVVHPYVPSLPEVLLAVGGVAVAGIMIVIAIKFLPLLPASLQDKSA
jgi:molybdopterin-containing oxidoreductase family membrane subunit